MKRVVVPELLDSDSGTPQEVAGSLADLRMLNRYFGGVRTMSALISEVATQRKLSDITWLDVGGGAGDLATLTAESLRRSSITLHAVVVDRAPSHLNGTHPRVCGDALTLPFSDGSFDIVGSSLFAHHLEPDELARFAREGLRVARHAFVINDLIRHPLHWALASAGRLIYRSRITRHDAVASVRRAYTVDEMQGILETAGATKTSITTFYLYRMGVIAWKAPSTT
jgi:ubiquinone/menaquinone biosynthesis C-methylase UbiE